MIKQISAVLLTVMALFAANFREASPIHPGDFPVESVPQFVVIGADDCSEAEAVLWIVDFLSKHKNPDGSPALMNFYVNGRYAQDNYSGAADTSVKKSLAGVEKSI